MKRFKGIWSVSVLGLGAFLAGCAQTPPQSELVTSPQGVTCSKCQTTWIQVRERTGSKMRRVAYRTRKVHECPDCASAVESFFTTGKLEHTCKTCGDSMWICDAH